MPLVDAHLRVRHPCPYCDLSVAFPRSLLLLWLDNRRDTILVCSPDAGELRRLLTELRRRFHASELLREELSALVVVPDFEWKDPPSVTSLARRGGVWALPPVVYADGRETYRLLSQTKGRLQALIRRLRRLGEAELLSVSEHASLAHVRDFPTASVHFFEGLTAPQLRALVTAHEHGLLEIPARSSWTSAAAAQGVGRSTYGEHLRKAQLRILANSASLLRARLSSSVSLGPAQLEGGGASASPSSRVRPRRARPAGRRAGSARRT